MPDLQGPVQVITERENTIKIKLYFSLNNKSGIRDPPKNLLSHLQFVLQFSRLLTRKEGQVFWVFFLTKRWGDF